MWECTIISLSSQVASKVVSHKFLKILPSLSHTQCLSKKFLGTYLSESTKTWILSRYFDIVRPSTVIARSSQRSCLECAWVWIKKYSWILSQSCKDILDPITRVIVAHNSQQKFLEHAWVWIWTFFIQSLK